jgi:hypothetical protein
MIGLATLDFVIYFNPFEQYDVYIYALLGTLLHQGSVRSVMFIACTVMYPVKCVC